MKLLYRTKNKAKLKSMKRIVQSLDIEIIGLHELDCPIPFIDENGANPLENAVIKAKQLYEIFQIPVFSCDSGLFFKNLDDRLQPGTHIRRVNGKELTDEEMIIYYSNLASLHHDQLIGYYQNAICFIYDKEHIYKSMDASLSTEPFLLVSQPHFKKVAGFPLDCLSVDIHSKQYFYDLKDKTVDQSAIEIGFKNFFEKCLLQIKKEKTGIDK